jgi:hypothetical protein
MVKMPSRLVPGAAPFGKASRVYLKLAPLCGGETEVKHASRISLDGHGALLLWDVLGNHEQVMLDRVSISQVLIVHHTPTDAHLLQSI